ncbi:MAG: aspartate 1-decarboxylase, partial [Neisseriaceae bacterium]|nr:aspartate 1-decarboxylase [Neisseriaceae bacterium]
GSGEICLNGAAARLVQPGDTVIIMSFVLLDKNEIAKHKPKVVLVDKHNKITQVIDGEMAGVIG